MTLPDWEPTPSYLILGATGGIGSAVCRKLAREGARLVVAARNPEKVEALAEELHALPYTLDARVPEQVTACVEKAVESHQRLDGVVNCVGSLLLKSAHITSDEDWNDTLATNLTSAFALVRASTKAMLKTGGSIVLLSSVAARVGLANHEAIAAAKGGIIGLTRASAASYASKRIRVNCVAPGLVRTPMTHRLTENESALKTSEAMHPLGRIGAPDDIASAIVWLLSPEQNWLTGQVLSVDGGLSTIRPRA